MNDSCDLIMDIVKEVKEREAKKIAEDPLRIPRILKKIVEIWQVIPETPFCQIVYLVLSPSDFSFEIDDVYFETKLDEWLNK